LWEAANILRGPVDAADFKTYVFPLLFFKRISDVHDEEYRAALEESGGDEEYARFPQNYRFQIPEDCHWEDVRTVATNVGAALQKAMRGIEKANPETLYGIFGDAQWTNKDRLPDALLRDLIEHFSRIGLGNEAAQADILGQSYEYLIKKFADATNKKAGEFYTPRSVVRLMVNILDPREGESIYDPACGTGGMLLEAVHHVRENHGDDRTLWGKLFGQEKNLTTSAIARMNLFLHGASDFQMLEAWLESAQQVRRSVSGLLRQIDGDKNEHK
jgi:type I restriction enzyme M protein